MSIHLFNLVKRINKTAKNLWGGDLTGQGERWEGERKKKKERNEIKIQIHVHVLLNAVIVLDLSANQEELCKYLATNYGSFEYLYQ